MKKRSFITRSAAILLGITLGFGTLSAGAFKSEPVKAAEITRITGSSTVETVGDINGDGEINAKDVTMLRRHLAGGWGVTVNEEDADINGDGEVNAKDVTMLRRYLAGGWGVAMPEKKSNDILEGSHKIVKVEVSQQNNFNYDEIYHEPGFYINMYGDDGNLYNSVYINYDRNYNVTLETWQYAYENGKRIKGVGKDNDGSTIITDYEYKDDQIIESYIWKGIPERERTVVYDNNWLLKSDDKIVYESLIPDDYNYKRYEEDIHNFDYAFDEGGTIFRKSDNGSSVWSGNGAGHEAHWFYEYYADGLMKSQGTIYPKDEEDIVELGWINSRAGIGNWLVYVPYVNYYYDENGNLIKADLNYQYSERVIDYDNLDGYDYIQKTDNKVVEFVRDSLGIIDKMVWVDNNGRTVIFRLEYNSDGSFSRITYDIEVAIDEDSFPDTIFRDFVKRNYDTDSNGILSKDELQAVTVIDCEPDKYAELGVSESDYDYNMAIQDAKNNYYLSGNGIKTLKGIEQFTELSSLDCSYNQITELNVTHNKKLVNLWCTKNHIKDLNFSSNTELEIVECTDNELSYISVSGDNDRLNLLSCSNNALKKIDVSNSNLESLYCSNNNLTELDLEWCRYLDSLDCSYNNLSKLILPYSAGLIYLCCNDNSLTELDLSENVKLGFLCCYNNKITSLDLSDNTILTSRDMISVDDDVEITFAIGCSINEENFPDDIFRQFVSEKYDEDSNGFLDEYELFVEKMECYNMGISDFKGIEQFVCLEELNCSGNKLTSLDLSSNVALEWLCCSKNQLTSLNLENNKELTELICFENQLKKLDLSNNKNIEYVSCSSNALETICLENNILLEELDCSDNNLKVLDVSDCTDLIDLDCSGNRISSIDLSHNYYLYYLDCTNNNLTEIDLSNTDLMAQYTYIDAGVTVIW